MPYFSNAWIIFSEGMPSSCPRAHRCITQLVEPPDASMNIMAFSMASMVSICRAVIFLFTSSIIFSPVRTAVLSRSAYTAGIVEVPGRHIPSASVMQLMVFAVP